MKRYRRRLMILTLTLLLAVGCRNQKEDDILIYYLNTEGTGLTAEGCSWESEEVTGQIEQVCQRLRRPEDAVECTSALPADVEILSAQLKKTSLELDFSKEYLLLDKSQEVLLRAAVVQSLTQIEGVDFVTFLVEGETLKDQKGEPVGKMRGEDFTENTGASLNSYRQETMTLFFANAQGDRLVTETDTFRYNSNMSIERAVIEQLIKGPSSQNMKRTVPAETKLLGVSIKDGICYVNLTEEFLGGTEGVDLQMKVYGLTNSIIEAGNCDQVQIMVNGETPKDESGVLDLGKPLTENLEIVEGQK